MSDVTELTVADLSRRIAGLVGDEGFEGAIACPAGHLNYRYKHSPSRVEAPEAGELCQHCGERIGRGEPKPYAESLDLLVHVVREWCWRRIDDEGVIILRWADDPEDPTWMAYVGKHPHPTTQGQTAYDATEALARAFLAAVDRWGWK